MITIWTTDISHLSVIPVLIGPLQILLVALPALFVALFSIIVSIAKPRAVLKLFKLLWHQKASVLVITILVLGGRYALNHMNSSTQGTEPDYASNERKIDWPMFRGGLTRVGVVPGELGPLSADINWTWKYKNDSYMSSPALTGNRIYITSADINVLNQKGNIYCLDTETGSLVWSKAPDDYQPTLSSPSVSSNYLVCGEGMHLTRNARIVALDISDERNVRIAWTFRTASHVECTPTIHNGRVYVGAGDDGFYCLELEPDSNGDPVVVWHITGDDYPDAETALAVYDNRVYAGLGVGGEALCVLDAETGEEIKRLTAKFPIFTPPAISNGRIYIGLGIGNYIFPSSEVRANEMKRLRSKGASEEEMQQAAERLTDGGEVWCIDMETLEKLWVYKCRSTVLSAICAVDEGVCFSTRDGQVNLLDHEGKLIVSKELFSTTLSSPAVTPEYIYQFTANGYLYALDRKTLEPEWDVRIGSGYSCISSPAISDGRLYVGTEKDGFLSVGSRDVAEKVIRWPGHLGGAGKSGNPYEERFSELGNFLWQYPQSYEGDGPDKFIVAPPASLKDRIYIPIAEDKTGIACLEITKPGHKTPDALWFYQTANGVVKSPVVTSESVFLTDTGNAEKQGHLHHLSAADGSVLWKKELKPGASGFITLQNNSVLVQDGAESLSAYSFKGENLWNENFGALTFPPASMHTMAVLSVNAGKTLLLIDVPTGKQLWKTELEFPATTAPVIHKGEIITGTSRGLEYRSMIDGSMISIVDVKPAGCRGTVTIANDRIFCSGGNGEGLIEFFDYKLIKIYKDLKDDINPIITPDGAILYLTDDGLMSVGQDKENVNPRLWADVSWLGNPTSPMILHNKTVYLGMSGWGLVCIGGEQ